MRRPPAAIPQIVDALHRRTYQEAADLLSTWYVGLTVERTSSGPVWFIDGGVGQREAFLVCAMQALPRQSDAIEIVLGWRAMWRRRAMDMWAAGAYDDLRRRLSETLERYAPWNYLYWGRLLAYEGHQVGAGMFMLLSGIYDPEERPLVTAYQQHYQRAHPNQVAAELPEPARQRWARAYYPERVLTDFAAMPSPAWLRRRVPPPEWLLPLAEFGLLRMPDYQERRYRIGALALSVVLAGLGLTLIGYDLEPSFPGMVANLRAHPDRP